MVPFTLRLALLTSLITSALAAADRTPHVLVYTRNYTPDGKGYVHDNIATSVEAIRKIGAEAGFIIESTDDPSVFNADRLKPFDAIVFANSNNEAFANDSQREAFKRFIVSGKGFVGLHSASGSERSWPAYWSILGGKFAFHPKMQTFTVTVADRDFSGTKDLPASFEWTDECYFHTNLSPAIHPILSTDRTKLAGLEKAPVNPSTFPNPLPLAWYQNVEGGREFYLGLGHRKEEYSDPILVALIRNGIVWALGRNGVKQHESTSSP